MKFQTMIFIKLLSCDIHSWIEQEMVEPASEDKRKTKVNDGEGDSPSVRVEDAYSIFSSSAQGKL